MDDSKEFNNKYTEFKKALDIYIKNNVLLISENALLINENEQLKTDLEKLKKEKDSYEESLNMAIGALMTYQRNEAVYKATRKNIRRRKPKSKKP
jgi:predicted nuclease with TOPRIM domain